MSASAGMAAPSRILFLARRIRDQIAPLFLTVPGSSKRLRKSESSAAQLRREREAEQKVRKARKVAFRAGIRPVMPMVFSQGLTSGPSARFSSVPAPAPAPALAPGNATVDKTAAAAGVKRSADKMMEGRTYTGRAQGPPTTDNQVDMEVDPAAGAYRDVLVHTGIGAEDEEEEWSDDEKKKRRNKGEKEAEAYHSWEYRESTIPDADYLTAFMSCLSM